MKLNTILISLFATVAYASKADIMALREEMRNAKTEEERTAIREKLKNMGPATRGKLRKDPRMRDRTPHADLSNTDFDHKAMRADTKAFMETIKDVTDSEERKQLLRAHKVEVMAKLRGNRI